MSDRMGEYPGLNGTIEIRPNYLIIKRRNVLTLFTRGFIGGIRIPFANLASIHFKEATDQVNGVIQFRLSGRTQSKGKWNAQNTVMFSEGDLDAFVHLRRMLERVIAETRTARKRRDASEPKGRMNAAHLNETNIISV